MSKLSYEDKINLYNDRKKGYSISSLCSKYNIRHEVVKYLTRLIDKYGYDILWTSKNIYHSALKNKLIVESILLNNEAINSVAIDEYINYYNYDRIKVKLKGLFPVKYRLQSSN